MAMAYIGKYRIQNLAPDRTCGPFIVLDVPTPSPYRYHDFKKTTPFLLSTDFEINTYSHSDSTSGDKGMTFVGRHPSPPPRRNYIS